MTISIGVITMGGRGMMGPLGSKVAYWFVLYCNGLLYATHAKHLRESNEGMTFGLFMLRSHGEDVSRDKINQMYG